MSYVPLWVKSNGSFLEGASHPEELVERAHQLGLGALALTDRDGVYGAVQAYVKARELGIRLLVGAQLSVSLDPGDLDVPPWHVLLLAKGRAGYAELCQLISRGRARCPKGQSRVSLQEVQRSAGDLIALCPVPELLAALRTPFGRDLYALCARHREAGEVSRERKLRDRARALNVPVAAAVEVLYHDAERRPLQDVLTCIRHGCTLGEAGRRIRPNAEHDLKAPDAMAALFGDDPEALRNTLRIAEQCRFDFAQIRYRYPAEAMPEGRGQNDWLRELTWQGAARRYPRGVPEDVAAQLSRELSLIGDLDYGGYFLTMYEIVEFCRREGILCQGRGSAANSAVCFCLGITAVDPVRMELLFERFLSRERAEPPDIDLDIEHARREEVIQWVYARYGRRRAAMVANLIRYRARSAVRDVGKALGISGTETDGIARLLGHYSDTLDAQTLAAAGLDVNAPAFALLLSLCQQILDFPRHLSIHPGGFLLGHEPVDTLVPIEPATMEGRTVIQWDKYDVEALSLFKVDLLGLGALTVVHHSFRLLEQHRGLVLEMARVPHEDPATYRMLTAGDTVGVFQIESRAQMAMLPRLKPRTFYDLVIEVAIVRPGPIQGDMVHPYLRRRNGEEPVSFPHPSLEKVLRKTLGVPIFQEQVMKLAVEAAGYTPGESDGLRRDMAAWRSSGRIEAHHERLVRRMIEHGIPEEFAERVFSQIRGFGEYGFPESHAASFALIAYVTAWLRRHHPEVFLCAMLNAQPMGFYAPGTLVEDGARHGVTTLPVDVNYSAWDCTLTPVDTESRRDDASEPPTACTCTCTCSTAPADRRDDVRRPTRACTCTCTTTPAATESGRKDAGEVVAEPSARKAPSCTSTSTRLREDSGEVVAEPSACKASSSTCTCSRSRLAVRVGFRYVKGLGSRERARIEAVPRPVDSLEQFVRRSRLSIAALAALAEAGAFQSLGLSRREALWRVRGQVRSAADPLPSGPGSHAPELAQLSAPEEVLWDYRTTQSSPRGHPMQQLRPWLERRGALSSEQVREARHGARVEHVGLVICRQRPGTATGVVFMTLEDELGFVNAVLWTAVYERYKRVVRTASLVGVAGIVQSVDGVVHLIVDHAYLPGVTLDAHSHGSRDFH